MRSKDLRASRDAARHAEQLGYGESSGQIASTNARRPMPAEASYILYPVGRLTTIVVPAELLKRGLQDYSRPAATGALAPLSAILLEHVIALDLSGDPVEVALTARLPILALAGLVADGLLEEWVRRGYPSGIVLFHDSLFKAAAVEPLVLFPPDGIGFDPESLRRNVLRSASVKGSA